MCKTIYVCGFSAYPFWESFLYGTTLSWTKLDLPLGSVQDIGLWSLSVILLVQDEFLRWVDCRLFVWAEKRDFSEFLLQTGLLSLWHMQGKRNKLQLVHVLPLIAQVLSAHDVLESRCLPRSKRGQDASWFSSQTSYRKLSYGEAVWVMKVFIKAEKQYLVYFVSADNSKAC